MDPTHPQQYTLAPHFGAQVEGPRIVSSSPQYASYGSPNSGGGPVQAQAVTRGDTASTWSTMAQHGGVYQPPSHFDKSTTAESGQYYQSEMVNNAYPASSGYQTSGYQMSANSYQVQGASGVSSRYISTAGVMSTADRHITETSRVVGVEVGEERVISTTEHLGEPRIINTRYEEHIVRRPKKRIMQVMVEKKVLVPEYEEEIIEEDCVVRQKIVEFGQPRIEEKIVEIPEWEIVEITRPVPEYVKEEQVVQKEVLVYKTVEVPTYKKIEVERLEYYDDIQYVDVPTHKTVEVPEIHEEIIYNEIPVPQEVLVPVARPVEVVVNNDIHRNIPVAVEAIVAYEFRIPKLKGHYTKVTYPVYLPRFIEMPIAAELYNVTITSKAQDYLSQILSLTKTAASLCDIENLAKSIIQADLVTQCNQVDVRSAVLEQFNAMRLV